MTTLFHFTCDHGHAQLGPEATIVPIVTLLKGKISSRQEIPWTGQYSWFTDLDHPDRNGLGLTSHTLRCDRTAHRYRVVNGAEGDCQWWMDIRDRLDPQMRDQLEQAPGAKPGHWWVSAFPIPVVYDPVGVLA